MATIRPFRGIRPDPSYVSKVVSPPYDVIDREEARSIAADNPYSFLHISRSDIDFPKDRDLYDVKIYEKAKDNIRKMIEKKYFSSRMCHPFISTVKSREADQGREF